MLSPLQNFGSLPWTKPQRGATAIERACYDLRCQRSIDRFRQNRPVYDKIERHQRFRSLPLYRVDCAKALLRDWTLSLLDVALSFADQSHFT